MTVAHAEAPAVALRATCKREDLLAGLNFTARFLPARPPVPVLAGIIVSAGHGGLTLRAYDYEWSAQTVVVAPGAVGEALVPGRALLGMVRALPKGCAVRMEVKGNRLIVRGGEIEYREPLLPLADYPTLPDVAAMTEIATADATTLAALCAPLVAVGRDDTLPVLTGIYVEVRDGLLTTCGTDRYRLAVMDSEVPARKTTPLLIPARWLDVALKAFGKECAPITLGVIEPKRAKPGDPFANRDRLAVLTCGQRHMTTRLLDGEFPKYRALLPQQDEAATAAVIDRADLVDTVRAVAVVIERNAPVRLTLDGGSEWATFNGGYAYDEDDDTAASSSGRVKAATEGEALHTAFNPGFLLDGLAAFHGADTVRVAMTAPTRPAIVTAPEVKGLTYLLMPVRLSS